MSWLDWFRRREPPVTPPPPVLPPVDLRTANHKAHEAERKLRETRRTDPEMEAHQKAARRVTRRVDRFTAEMDESFRRLGHGHW